MVKRSAAPFALVPSGVVTVTSTVPLPGGETTVIWSADTLYTAAATVPKSTAVVPVKSLPLTVTCVPPAAGPDDGLIPVTTGAGLIMCLRNLDYL